MSSAFSEQSMSWSCMTFWCSLFGAMDGLSGSQATTLALQLNSLFLHHSMNTYRLCFKASDILNGSVSLQFIIGLADSLADQVTKFPLPLLTITKLHPPPQTDPHQIPTPTDHHRITTHCHGVRNLSIAQIKLRRIPIL